MTSPGHLFVDSHVTTPCIFCVWYVRTGSNGYRLSGLSDGIGQVVARSDCRMGSDCQRFGRDRTGSDCRTGLVGRSDRRTGLEGATSHRTLGLRPQTFVGFEEMLNVERLMVVGHPGEKNSIICDLCMCLCWNMRLHFPAIQKLQWASSHAPLAPRWRQEQFLMALVTFPSFQTVVPSRGPNRSHHFPSIVYSNSFELLAISALCPLSALIDS